MYLAAKTRLHVLAKESLNIAPGLSLCSDTPFWLEVNEPTVLKGFEVLDERFAKGWAKLPAELKIEILSYDEHINGEIRIHAVGHVSPQSPKCKVLERYHAMTPEIGSLATQIFYGTRDIIIGGVAIAKEPDDPDVAYPVVSTLLKRFPTLEINRWIKSLKVHALPDAETWDWLDKVALGSFRFTALRFLALLIEFHPGRKVLLVPEIKLWCKGKVMVVLTKSSEEVSETKKESARCMQQYLQKRIVFETDSRTRYWDEDGCERRIADDSMV